LERALGSPPNIIGPRRRNLWNVDLREARSRGPECTTGHGCVEVPGDLTLTRALGLEVGAGGGQVLVRPHVLHQRKAPGLAGFKNRGWRRKVAPEFGSDIRRREVIGTRAHRAVAGVGNQTGLEGAVLKSGDGQVTGLGVGALPVHVVRDVVGPRAEFPSNPRVGDPRDGGLETGAGRLRPSFSGSPDFRGDVEESVRVPDRAEDDALGDGGVVAVRH